MTDFYLESTNKTKQKHSPHKQEEVTDLKLKADINLNKIQTAVPVPEVGK